MSSSSQPNVIKVDGPGGYNYGPGAPESDASAPGAGVPQHYLDIYQDSGALYQSFVPQCSGTVDFGGAFATRANSGGSARITLRQGTGTSGPIISAITVNLPGGAFNTTHWTPFGTTAAVTAMNSYSLVISMDNDMNFDNGFVNYRHDCDPHACIQVTIEDDATCNRDGTITLTAHVMNTSGHAIQYVMIAPASGATYAVSPNTVAVPLNSGQSTAIIVTVTGASVSQPICLTFLLQDSEGQTCCVVNRCFSVHCACMKVIQQSIGCDPGPAVYAFSFTLQNLTGSVIQQVFAIPSSGSLTPQVIGTNIPAYGSVPVTLHLSGVTAGQTICIVLQAYGDQLGECCSIRVCVTLPPIEVQCD